MKKTMKKSDFRDGFNKIRPDSFSNEGLSELYDLLMNFEDDCEVEFEFDPIAFDCEWSELSFNDFVSDYVEDEEILEDIKNEIILNFEDLKRFYSDKYENIERVFNNGKYAIVHTC